MVGYNDITTLEKTKYTSIIIFKLICYPNPTYICSWKVEDIAPEIFDKQFRSYIQLLMFEFWPKKLEFWQNFPNFEKTFPKFSSKDL